MIKVGITGGIGAGKSLVSAMLTAMGYPVYDCDIAAKKLMQSAPEIKEKLIALLGKEIYTPEGLDKKKLAAYIFNNEDLLLQVNQIVHPVVKSDFERWCSLQNSPIVFLESAILFESGFQSQVDYICTVTAPEEVRISRAMRRDNVDAEQIIARIDKQIKDEEKCRLSHFSIVNDNITPVLPQILEVIRLFENNKY